MNGCSCAKNELSLHTEKTSTHERATEASTVHTFPFRVVHKNIPSVLLVSTSASTFDAPALPSMPLAIGFSMNLASLPVTVTQRPFKRLVLGTLPVWEAQSVTTNQQHSRTQSTNNERLARQNRYEPPRNIASGNESWSTVWWRKSWLTAVRMECMDRWTVSSAEQREHPTPRGVDRTMHL